MASKKQEKHKHTFEALNYSKIVNVLLYNINFNFLENLSLNAKKTKNNFNKFNITVLKLARILIDPWKTETNIMMISRNAILKFTVLFSVMHRLVLSL